VSPLFAAPPDRKHRAQLPYIRGRTLDIGYAEFPNHFVPNLEGVDIVLRPPDLPGNYGEVRQADLNTSPLPYPDSSFDAALLNDIIEHVVNPLALLSECNRVLRQGGTLIVSTPNPYYYWEFMQNLLVRFRFMKAVQEGHFMAFTRINMRTILKRTGFELVKEMGNFFTLIILKWTFFLPRLPFLTYQITYVTRKVGTPQHYVLSKPAGLPLQQVPTTLGFAPRA